MSALSVVKKFFPQVESIVDATRNAKIEVSKADASSSAVKRHDACAMAVACKRKFHLDGVIISRTVAYLIKGKKARRFKLPESISREIVSFDRGAGFTPGNYELAKVEPANLLGPRNRPQKKKNRDAREKRVRHMTKNVRGVLGGQKPEGEK